MDREGGGAQRIGDLDREISGISFLAVRAEERENKRGVLGT